MISIRAPGRIGKGGVQGKRCPGTRAESRQGVPRPIIVLGRLALGPGLIEALGLGRLARGTEPEPNPSPWYPQCPPFS